MDRNEALKLWRSTLPGRNIIDEWVITAILAAYQRGIEDAIKAVPKPADDFEHDFDETVGFNKCRAEMLRRLEEMK